MTTRRRTPDATRRSQATRRAILTAALELAGEVGYERLTIEGIAARAGAGKQTIYRWWPSKGAVLFDALLMLSEGQGDEPAELPDTGDLEADLKTVLRATVDELNDPRRSEPMRALAVETLLDPALAADFAERLDEPVRQIKLRRLRRAQQAGQLAPDADLDVAVDMIWGPLERRWLHRRGPLTAGFADAVVETALDGLRRR
ncbi:TetR family transcriptional regulator [Streptomyces sp. SCUT-3]|uniref:TetR/AcrR family transcriptional regulator n=1 Tax=Streptomyces TaxID=1883 RepID=UPI000CC87050|nr:TetR/AcrR family transcriptional regulator [Streptomyces sp. SCUT-3]PLW73266.1 TetR family transcriptional regulator [Streptomyces sp. DJ]QMV20708.1 TetR family transcriptional regulator [Streptomyces sp. SCUT-3]